MAEAPAMVDVALSDADQGGEDFPYRTVGALSVWLDTEAADGLMSQFQASLGAARALNRLAFDEADLVGLVGALDRRVFPMLAILGKQVDRVRGPVAPAHRAMVAEYASLLQEFAALQLRVAAEGFERGILDTDAAGRCLRRAVYLGNRLSLHLWRLYQAEPPGFWLQLHQALELAESLGIASQAPAVGEAGPGCEPDSVEALAARIAVLASSDVYSLRPEEAPLLASWLEAMPLRLSESVEPRGEDQRPLLRIQFAVDRPPSLLVGKGEASPGVRFIDLGPLVAALRFTPPKANASTTIPGGADDLSRRLQRRWIVPPMRQFRREPADLGPLVTVTGLHAIHRMIRADYRSRRSVDDVQAELAPGGYFAPESDDPDEIPAIFAVAEVMAEAGPEVNVATPVGATPREVELLSPGKLERLRTVWDTAAAALGSRGADVAADGQGVSSAATPGWLRNVGAGGCCLRLQAPDEAIFGGNLIAIRIACEERITWQAGVIRWLRYDSPNTATIGVQYLTQSCVPVEVSCSSPEDPTFSRVQPGLFYRERGRPNAGSLLLDPDAFGAGMRVNFNIGTVRFNVLLESVRLESQVFTRADFTLREIGGNSDLARVLGQG